MKAYIVVSHAVLKENGGNREKHGPLKQFEMLTTNYNLHCISKPRLREIISEERYLD